MDAEGSKQLPFEKVFIEGKHSIRHRTAQGLYFRITAYRPGIDDTQGNFPCHAEICQSGNIDAGI